MTVELIGAVDGDDTVLSTYQTVETADARIAEMDESGDTQDWDELYIKIDGARHFVEPATGEWEPECSTVS